MTPVLEACRYHLDIGAASGRYLTTSYQGASRFGVELARANGTFKNLLLSCIVPSLR